MASTRPLPHAGPLVTEHGRRGMGRRHWMTACASWSAWPLGALGATQGAQPVVPPALWNTLRASGLPSHSFGLQVQPLTGGAPVVALNVDRSYVMASTAKLVTTYAALDLLGPQYRWRTYAFATGPVYGGILKGDLLIVGGGNALLTTADLHAWFTEMRAGGLHVIQGDIVLDRFAFVLQESDHIGTPPPSALRPHHRRPDALALDGRELTAPAVRKAWATTGGALRGYVIDKSVPDRDGLIISGRDGGPLLPYAVHRSPPLPELVKEINKTSDNRASRNLMLSLARGFPSRAATLEAARERVRGWLTRHGIDASELSLDNGSGLSRAERCTPRALVTLLDHAWKSQHVNAFVESLPVAGLDGTLGRRMTRGAATGRAWLKTGTLHDTRALAGYVQGASTRMYAVAALVNHSAAARATSTLDGVIEWLARHA